MIAGAGRSGAAASNPMGVVTLSSSGPVTKTVVVATTQLPAIRQSTVPRRSVWMTAKSRRSPPADPSADGSSGVAPVLRSQSDKSCGAELHCNAHEPGGSPVEVTRTVWPSVSPAAGVTVTVGAVRGAAAAPLDVCRPPAGDPHAVAMMAARTANRPDPGPSPPPPEHRPPADTCALRPSGRCACDEPGCPRGRPALERSSCPLAVAVGLVRRARRSRPPHCRLRSPRPGRCPVAEPSTAGPVGWFPAISDATGASNPPAPAPRRRRRRRPRSARPRPTGCPRRCRRRRARPRDPSSPGGRCAAVSRVRRTPGRPRARSAGTRRRWSGRRRASRPRPSRGCRSSGT